MRPRSGPALILAAAVVWGTAGAVQELAVPSASPVAVGAVRCLLGGVLLAVLAGPRLRTVTRAAGACAVAVLAMVAFQAGYLTAIRTTGVAVGTLVAIGSAPVFAGALDAARGRRPDRGWAVATAVSVTGLALVVAPGSTAVEPSGLVAALVAGIGYAGYVQASARLADRVPPTAALAVVFLTAGAVLALAPGGRAVGSLDLPAVAGHLWLGLGTIGLGYLVFLAGLRRSDAPTATTLTLAEPLTATILAVALVGERLTAVGVVGVALLLVGLAAAGRAGRLPPRVGGTATSGSGGATP